MGATEAEELTELVRAEHGRIVAALIRRYGDVDLAEEAVAEALAVAWPRWSADGPPPNPAGWLTTTAHRKALDRLRRESTRTHREQEAMAMLTVPREPLGVVDDDRLRLFFLCCHPALGRSTQVALTLRLVAGLSVAEIAAGFLVEERAMAQRITRAKRKIADARIPFRVPERDDLTERLGGVLAALYLTFNESYLSVGAESGHRPDLAEEAVRLTRQLAGLLPAEPEVRGLLALLLLTRAREEARVVEGRLVPLDEQERSRWDAARIAEGRRLVRELLTLGRPGPYQVQAAISAAHTDETVPWAEVVALYDLLLSFTPTPVARLNRALAVAHVDGPAEALRQVETLDLARYHPWHVARAHLLADVGRTAEASAALDAALALDPTPLEREHLRRWRAWR